MMQPSCPWGERWNTAVVAVPRHCATGVRRQTYKRQSREISCDPQTPTMGFQEHHVAVVGIAAGQDATVERRGLRIPLVADIFIGRDLRDDFKLPEYGSLDH